MRSVVSPILSTSFQSPSLINYGEMMVAGRMGLRHYIAGGCCHAFSQNGVEFTPGLGIQGSLDPGSNGWMLISISMLDDVGKNGRVNTWMNIFLPMPCWMMLDDIDMYSQNG